MHLHTQPDYGQRVFQISAYHTLGEPGYTPTTSTSQEFQYGDTLGIVYGKHALKMGLELRWSQFNLFQIGPARGSFGFTGEFSADSPSSGDGWAGIFTWHSAFSFLP